MQTTHQLSCVGEGRGGGGGADLLDLLDEEEKTPRFQSSFSKPEILGDNALDMFIDRLNPYNRQAHPALPNVMKQLDDVRKKRGTCTVHSTVFTLLRLLPSHFKVFRFFYIYTIYNNRTQYIYISDFILNKYFYSIKQTFGRILYKCFAYRYIFT